MLLCRQSARSSSPLSSVQSPVNRSSRRSAPVQSPLNPVQSPLNPEQSPLNPEQSPLNPEQLPLNPVQSPLNPVQSPLNPEQSPLNPEQSPLQSGAVAANPEQSPLNPVQSPRNPVQSPRSPEQSPRNPVQSPYSPVQSPRKYWVGSVHLHAICPLFPFSQCLFHFLIFLFAATCHQGIVAKFLKLYTARLSFFGNAQSSGGKAKNNLSMSSN